MTRNQIKASLLAGLPVLVVAGIYLRFLPALAQAQNRVEVLAAINAHTASRYVTRTQPDGGAYVEDTLQISADACRASRIAYREAKATHYALGTPTAGSLRVLLVAWEADCASLATLRAAVDAAKTVEQGAEDAYECLYIRDCDGGT